MGVQFLALVLGWLALSDAILPNAIQTETISKGSDKASKKYSVRNLAATDQNGRPVPSMTASLTLDKNGPILMQDVNYISQMAHFDRERIPERVVHAKGAGAHGYFTVTNDITEYTRASLFAGVGKRTNVFVRFSTVIGESGSADTASGPRGFATKFYTDHGNWDLVGNNLIIFSIRDPILFPSFIHSQKRNPSTHLKDNNAIWDFFSLRPESTQFALQVNSDLGNPDGYRFMDGGGVHTFKLVNNTGSPVYVKFHWKTNQGTRNITTEQATVLAGTNPDYATQDLFEAIASGDFPSWTMYIQVMTFEQAENYRFNPFDATKLWLEEDFPLIPVGEMILNRNPVDYFTEVEMSAFDPGSLVPGIEFSPDRMLIGRSFSYLDTQRYRLGANFLQLPINRPKNPVNTYQRDGAGSLENGNGGPNYFPNSFNGPKVSQTGAESVYEASGDVVRYDTGEEDNFSQPRIFLNSLNAGERSRLISNLAASFDGVNDDVLERSIANLKSVNVDFGQEVKDAIVRRRLAPSGSSKRNNCKDV